MTFPEFMREAGAEHHALWQGIANVYLVPEAKVAVEWTDETSPISGYEPRASLLVQVEARRQVEEATGFAIFRVHEAEWQRSPGPIRHWLSHKLGKAPRLCSAREADLRLVSGAEARIFYGSFHLQKAANGGRHFGLVYAGRVVACLTLARYCPGRRGLLRHRTFNLSRFAAAGSVPGGASKLFRYAVDAVGADRVVTFSDQTYAAGGVYAVLGFVRDGLAHPEYQVYHARLGITHKAHWQRNLIHARLRELGFPEKYDHRTDSRTEFEMCRLMGCRHVWDLGKVRWLWTRPKASFLDRARRQVQEVKRGGQPGNKNAAKGRRPKMVNIRLPVTRGGNSKEYLLRRMARDHPAILARLEAGELRSVRAAAVLAGIVRPAT